MIARLTGKIVHKSIDHLIIDVNGVGYDIKVPLTTLYELPEPGDEISLHTYLNVREDALVLYGFSSESDKDVFLQLITINGIGPKLALTILSGISVPDLIDAIISHDILRLSTIPGIGKKTASRMALELKDKIGTISPVETTAVKSEKIHDVDTKEDVVSALMNLGYKRNMAENAYSAALRGGIENNIEDILKAALKTLSKR